MGPAFYCANIVVASQREEPRMHDKEFWEGGGGKIEKGERGVRFQLSANRNRESHKILTFYAKILLW